MKKTCVENRSNDSPYYKFVLVYVPPIEPLLPIMINIRESNNSVNACARQSRDC